MFLHSRLYGITPDAVPADWIVQAADCAFAAGLRVLQLRSKHLSPDEKRLLGQKLLVSAVLYGAVIIINDDMCLAADIAAHGVHLGGDDGDIAAARVLLGDTAIVGASCYNSLQRAQAAVAQGANYVAFGALFPSSTKPHAHRAALSLFQAAAPLGVATVGIGGITVENAANVTTAGASAVAIVSGLFPAAGQHTLSSYSTQVGRNTTSFLDRLNQNTLRKP